MLKLGAREEEGVPREGLDRWEAHRNACGDGEGSRYVPGLPFAFSTDSLAGVFIDFLHQHLGQQSFRLVLLCDRVADFRSKFGSQREQLPLGEYDGGLHHSLANRFDLRLSHGHDWLNWISDWCD
jgi:hypothetical protein